jgi:sugar lactone lactonase YvrE
VVLDIFNLTLQIFSPAGKLLRMIQLPPPNSNCERGFQRLAVDHQGNYLLAEQCGERIDRFSPRGKLLAAYSGSLHRQVEGPVPVSVDAAGNIYIGEITRIVKLSPKGRRLATWGHAGYLGPGAFLVVAGIAVDAAGDIYVADAGNSRIHELSPSGKPLRAWGILGSLPGQFARPESVFVNGRGVVYVADTRNSRIQRLSP